MGLLDFFSPLTPLAAAERLRDSATRLDLSEVEVRVAASLGVERHILLKERILFRIAFSETSVDHAYRKDPDSNVREMGEHLERLNSNYVFSMPNVPAEVAGELCLRARADYIMRQPNELAGKMLTSMYFGEFREVPADALLSFSTLVHGYARSTLVEAIELAKKLTAWKR